ncbi:MFS transporter [Bacillus infantis]|uniref:MFS transporter n=1 Tax=Bacillus infantis TaxID=324767 RepID=A0A5D4SUB4_9BACI|nr:MFS transporter [Bacillus infantis]TYS65436.1 MFS transporter [Bacillus infantis]
MGIFKNKNFTLLFLGRIVSNIGDSLYAVAAMWLVYDLGGSTFYTGLAGFLSFFPRIVQLLAGPFVDRIPIRSLLVYSQLIQAVLLLIVPIASYFDHLTVALVLIITPILTTLNMFMFPAQMAALPTFVEEKDLSRGNSLFTLAYQGIDIACNAVSGILIVMAGAISIYVLDAAAFLLGAYVFSLIQIPSKKAVPVITETKPKYFSELKDGVRMILFTPLARLLYGIILVNLAMGATFVVLPAFGKIMGGAETYGLLLTAQAIGSLAGAMAAPYIKLDYIPIGKLYAAAFCLSGIAWGLSIFSPWNWLAIVLFGLAFIPGAVTNIAINTVIQKAIPEKLLGRVFSAVMSLSGIAFPLGGLAGGTLGVVIGAELIILISGIITFLTGIAWIIDPVTRKLPPSKEIDSTVFEVGKVVGYGA